jgi:glycolate oxidase
LTTNSSAGHGAPGAAAIEAARVELARLLGPDEVLGDPLALRLYNRDASMIEGACSLVAFPADREQVAECLAIAGRHGLPVVPRGSGTGLAGGSTPMAGALVLVTTKMNRVLEVRPDDLLAWVEPGVLNLDLSERLRPLGFVFAPDPSSQQTSSVGGNVATNAGGPHCLAYGVTSGHVLAVELALPGGELVRLGAEGPEAPGYDLRGVVVGSEGTLGIVTAVCVRLTPIAPAVRTMLLDFETVGDAAATVAEVVAAGVVPAAMELLDRRILEVIEPYVHAGYPTDVDAVLLVEVDGLPGGVAAEAATIERIAREHRVGSIQVARDDAQRARLWKGRKSALGAVSRIAPHYYLHDTVVPRSKLAEVLASVYEITRRHDLIVVNMFHAGDGNLHPLLLFDRQVPGTLDRVLAASEEIVVACVEAGGVLSGEHGIGLEKRDLMPLLFTADDLAAQDCARSAFDPERCLNPGKVLPSGARCGDFAMARGRDLAEAVERLPEGSWI